MTLPTNLMGWVEWAVIAVAVLVVSFNWLWPVVKGLFGKIWPLWVTTTGDKISIFADEIAVLTALSPVALLIAKHQDAKAKDLMIQLKAVVMQWDNETAPVSTSK